MKYRSIFLLIGVLTLMMLPGCSLVAGIFKAGFWAAIILVVIVVGLIFYGFKKLKG